MTPQADRSFEISAIVLVAFVAIVMYFGTTTGQNVGGGGSILPMSIKLGQGCILVSAYTSTVICDTTETIATARIGTNGLTPVIVNGEDGYIAPNNIATNIVYFVPTTGKLCSCLQHICRGVDCENPGTQACETKTDCTVK